MTLADASGSSVPEVRGEDFFKGIPKQSDRNNP